MLGSDREFAGVFTGNPIFEPWLFLRVALLLLIISPLPVPVPENRLSLMGGAAASPSVVAVDPSPPPPPLRSSGSRSVLKRKRPAPIDIPSAEALPFKTEAVDGRREVAAESARYSVYCKNGRKRLEMEDRHKVSLDINGDPKLVGALQELYWLF